MNSSFALCIAITSTILLVAAQKGQHHSSSSKDLEAKTLIASGWWDDYDTKNFSLDHCKWHGVTCNNGGHVVGISLENAISFKTLNLLVFRHLVRIHIYGCQLGDRIPTQIGALSELAYLNLSTNFLTGGLPLSIGNLTKLETLDLSWNSLNGSIPSQIGALLKLEILRLEANNLNGHLPYSLGNLTNLQRLDISLNQISGSIPAEMGNLSNLAYLNLQRNKIGGPIPSTLCQLISLETMHLSHNEINGSIPTNIGNLAKLFDLDLVWCKFPKSSFPNRKLEDYPTDFPPPTQTKETYPIYIFFPLAPLVLALVGFLFLCKLKSNKVNPSQPLATKHGDIFKIWNFNGKIAYEEIIEATKDFDIKYCIGTGGYGSVYRAKLPNGRVVALKKLHRLEGQNPTYDKCFKNEAKILSQIRHQNIVKLFGYCLHKRCMFLIYDYMERGSLFCVLRYENEALDLDWIKRVNVVKSIAHALSYMHHDCTPPILHRDVSTNNILLNSKLEARLSDFGIARVLDPNSSNQTQIAGTRGYIAPGHQGNCCIYSLLALFFLSFLHKSPL
ncbi:Non-specific serine/threonine protein kinase [Handroanthus impetiginosus]|uniref:non-specific serine/threonine protein kinase n=1 Tax=Handroanthus impetiginosus TaxID=429701 RepID=A0A2G9GAL6_9LAMI|nr:Non-specific serine/threonine protein kinase [Handroanthus impetiginosus]